MRRPPHLPAVPLEGLDPLSTRVYEAFMRAVGAHRQLMFRVLAGEDTHPGQALCLRMLAERDGISQRELAGALHLSAPTVTAMLQRMEKVGTIERRPDATDQRITRVHLTPEGRARERNLRVVLGEAIGRVLDPIPEADRHELERLLGAMADGAAAAHA